MLDDTTRARDFPSLATRTYLNTAAEGIPPSQVLQALQQYAQDKVLGMDGRPLHEAQWLGVREEAARAFGLAAEDIGICSCSSEAYNLAALALNLQQGDEVIINDLDFPSGATPWLQPSCPATVRLWEARAGQLRVDDLVGLLGPRTRLLTTSLVSFFNGSMIPLHEVLDTVHAGSSALVAVDVTQALGRIPLALDGVDLIVSSTHKWILASHGGGLVGVPPKRRDDWTVPAGGWFHLENAFDADRFSRAVSRPGAASFSVGMPNYPAVYAVRAGLAYVQGIGVDRIDAYARPLLEACYGGVSKLPVELITPPPSSGLAGIFAFRHPKADAVHAYLHERNIHIMQHAGRLRVAIHGYNTMGDVETFLDILKEALDHV